jgi:hypothetical protein
MGEGWPGVAGIFGSRPFLDRQSALGLGHFRVLRSYCEAVLRAVHGQSTGQCLRYNLTACMSSEKSHATAPIGFASAVELKALGAGAI